MLAAFVLLIIVLGMPIASRPADRRSVLRLADLDSLAIVTFRLTASSIYILLSVPMMANILDKSGSRTICTTH